ncbi:O-acetyl-ADP-ribose deacetylase [Neisseriaceae bacterium PsAf]|nr:O-acetyl-ADP-ribose deacetylase [Neisseriaceae bacterium PsAf]MCV2503912.1 O-acetyl-ADP-ribose deacetylase [Neisseriaceae bacterium]
MDVICWQGDITTLKVDAIVNAANTSLLGGGGVDGAIHRAAGGALLEACKKFNGCATGEARITPGFNLPARYVIHTPGPIWKDGKHHEQELLSQCYQNSLKLAQEYGCESIAFPAISTGVYHFPLKLATEIAVNTIQDYCLASDYDPQIILVAFDANTQQVYQAVFNQFGLDDKNK